MPRAQCLSRQGSTCDPWADSPCQAPPTRPEICGTPRRGAENPAVGEPQDTTSAHRGLLFLDLRRTLVDSSEGLSRPRRSCQPTRSLRDHGCRLAGRETAELLRQLDRASRPLGQVSGQLNEGAGVLAPGLHVYQLLQRGENRQYGRVAGARHLCQPEAHPLADNNLVLQVQCRLSSEAFTIEEPMT